MRILAFIEDREVIRVILNYLGLWLVKSNPAPKAHAPPLHDPCNIVRAMGIVEPQRRIPRKIAPRGEQPEKIPTDPGCVQG
jgi:hypothetical protein